MRKFAMKNHNVWRTLTFTMKNKCLLNVIVLFRFTMGAQITFTPVVILLVKVD